MKVLLEKILRFVFLVFDVFLSKKYIVFSSRSAKNYSDNAKFLYEKFLEESHSNVYFYTKKKSVLKLIPSNGVYAYSLKGVLVLLRARILVFTHGMGDFQPYFPTKRKNRIFINLFHAIAVKRLNNSLDDKQQASIDLWDYFVVSSDFESQFIQYQLNIHKDKILVFGQARNDILCNVFQKDIISEKKLILYAPTFRDDSLTKLFPFQDKNLIGLDQFLENENFEIMIRLHLNDEQKYVVDSEYKGLKNIFFTGSDKIPSINDHLRNVDILITDYSSISLDFLLLDKPIGYIIYDFDEYNFKRGFSFDFHKHIAGPILSTQFDFQNLLLDEKDSFSTKRKLLKDKFHKYQDGSSANKLFQFITKL